MVESGGGSGVSDSRRVNLGIRVKPVMMPHSLNIFHFDYYSMAYHHEWSQSYLKDYRLTFEEHHMNNEWFNNMLSMLKDDGELYVPLLNKSFNKSGEEVVS
tara:strand:+ start:101 stop:403 length:303 start_codon:yes stop_codon:yes gene_type:complete